MTPPPTDTRDDLFPFTAVPLQRTRRDGWTPERQRQFIAALAATGVVAAAARAVGMSPQSAHRLRERRGAESFAAAWDRALREGYERAFERALSRALHGWQEPRFYRGRQVGTVQRYDDRLTLAALNAARTLGRGGRAGT